MGETAIELKPRRRRALHLVGAIAIAATALLVHLLFRTPSEPPFPALQTSFSGDSKLLTRTQIVPTLDTPIEKGKNIIWCAAFPAAWKKLQANVATPPIDLEGAADICRRLNAAADPTPDISADSLYANAGWIKDGIIATIQKDMRSRFPDVAPPKLDGVAADGALAYAYLQANVHFTIPYFQNREPFMFTDSTGRQTQLRAFGLRRKDEDAYHELRNQVKVLYEKNHSFKDRPEDAEFALDLCRDSLPNQIVVACVPPAQTLEKTLAGLEAAIASWEGRPKPMGDGLMISSILLVPDIFWQVTHHFDQLEHKRFRDPSAAGFPLDLAMQQLQFRLDRNGAELKAEAKLRAKSAVSHYLINRPFLLYVKNRDARRPFFVMWIDNAELLQPWPKDVKPERSASKADPRPGG